MFNALLVTRDDDKKTSASVQSIDLDQLPEGNVIVSVEYSTVNYKDGLCIGPGGGLVREYPHVPGIDFAGTVESSEDGRYKPGDKVVLTGWRVGESHWGGYAQKARVNADWLVPLPDGLTTRQAMAVGTAGLTYLKSLGASQIVAREEINETTKRPLESESWCGCVDAVGGAMLARVLGQLKYGGSAAAIGLAGGAQLPATVIPFLLRGVNILGIDSVMQPYENRLSAWKRIATDLPADKLDSMVQAATLKDLPDLGKAILKGEVKGRVVVDVNG